MTPIEAVLWALALGLVIIIVGLAAGVGIITVRTALATKLGAKQDEE